MEQSATSNTFTLDLQYEGLGQSSGFPADCIKMPEGLKVGEIGCKTPKLKNKQCALFTSAKGWGDRAQHDESQAQG